MSSETRAMSLGELARRLVELDRRRSEAREALRALDEERRALETTVLDEMTRQGVSQVRTAEGLVYLHRREWVRPRSGVERRRVVAALQAAGLADCVTVSTQALTARVREMGGVEALGPALADLVEVTEQVQARTRRG